MKKKMLRTIAIGIAVCSALTVGVFATNKPASQPDPQNSQASGEALKVRVNGNLVTFPDGQPYLDENGRTMVPVRFVAEKLNAAVTWDGSTQTAIIKKGDIRVDIPIGSKTLTVTEGKKVRQMEMDTQAVETGGRTYVPIRYVAEALGAYVDYADAFKTVGIYQNKLSADTIEKLREYDYTLPESCTTYEEAKANKSRYDEEKLEFFFGTKRDSFAGKFENYHEYLYDNTVCEAFTYNFDHYGKVCKPKNAEEYYDLLLKEAMAELGYESENISVTFESDNALMYHPSTHKFMYTTIRGVLTVRSNVPANKLTNVERSFVFQKGYGIKQVPENKTVTVAIDVHMGKYANGRVIVDTIVPLGPVQVN